MHHATGTSLPTIVITLVVLLLVLLRRIHGERLHPVRLFLMPAILVVLGLGATLPTVLTGLSLHGIDYAVLVADLILTVVMGGIRGRTVLVYPRDGTAWYRYGPLTVALWCLSILLRVAIGIYGARHGATQLVTSEIVLLMFGLTLLVQNTIVLCRKPGAYRQTPASAVSRT